MIDLARRHRILTPWTAFAERQNDGTLRTVHVPVDMPIAVSAGAPARAPAAVPVTIVEDSLIDPDVGACIAAGARRWKFSAPGAEVSVRVPVELEPA